MASVSPTTPEQALNFPAPIDGKCTILLSDHICWGQVSVGGYVAAAMQKVAVLYASRNPHLKTQKDVRSSSVGFHRPIFPSQGTCQVNVAEVSIGRAWSTLRLEMYQGDSRKACSTADIIITNFDFPGTTLETGWQLPIPPTPVDFTKLENHTDPGWTSYQAAFHPQGFRRASAYARCFIPVKWSPEQTYAEQWMLPGWDCTPTGGPDPSLPAARWTDEIIPILIDSNVPVQENYYGRNQNEPDPVGRASSTLVFCAAQKKNRDEGRQNWRELPNDGSSPEGYKLFQARGNMVSYTLHMTLETKKKLPSEGVRWLYLRTEVKSIQNGRMDLQVLCFDEDMELVAIKNGVEQLLPAANKNQRKASAL